MATTHSYPVHVSWTGGRDGGGSVSPEHSGINVPIAVGQEFQGPGGGSNPEELLTSAVAACYTMTFGIIAVNRKLPYLGIETNAVGEVEQAGASFTYTKVTVTPTITLESGATEDQIKMAEDMAHKADAYCIVTNALRGKVAIEVNPVIKTS